AGTQPRWPCCPSHNKSIASSGIDTSRATRAGRHEPATRAGVRPNESGSSGVATLRGECDFRCVLGRRFHALPAVDLFAQQGFEERPVFCGYASACGRIDDAAEKPGIDVPRVVGNAEEARHASEKPLGVLFDLLKGS